MCGPGAPIQRQRPDWIQGDWDGDSVSDVQIALSGEVALLGSDFIL